MAVRRQSSCGGVSDIFSAEIRRGQGYICPKDCRQLSFLELVVASTRDAEPHWVVSSRYRLKSTIPADTYMAGVWQGIKYEKGQAVQDSSIVRISESYFPNQPRPWKGWWSESLIVGMWMILEVEFVVPIGVFVVVEREIYSVQSQDKLG
ncbi:hypothetical protein BGZ63DRAFT_397362 [Mariannaea sp. PMI_226]|nr:hypothetical protein BGZ63DRAFT_397362 [Mariannaea sp. PMI_226]